MFTYFILQFAKALILFLKGENDTVMHSGRNNRNVVLYTCICTSYYSCEMNSNDKIMGKWGHP